MTPFRFAFAGTPEFAAVHLRALLAAGHHPDLVLAQPDRPKGRGLRAEPGPVAALALEHGIELWQPVGLRDPELLERYRQRGLDLLAVVAYGLILPAAWLEASRLGAVNVHASLLPRWRGAAPIQRAIEAGDERTGVCLMKLDVGMDTGPVYESTPLFISQLDTSATLADRLAQLGAIRLLAFLDRLRRGELPTAVDQPEDGASHARKLSAEEALLDPAKPGKLLEQQIRAYNPWPVARIAVAGEELRVWKANIIGPRPAGSSPGQVAGVGPDALHLVVQDSVLALSEVQRPGGRRISGAEYARGRRL